MMEKKGQITVFIILGIILVAITGGVLIFKNFYTIDRYTALNNQVLQAESVKFLIQECLNIEGEKAISYVSAQGGYNALPENLEFIEYSIFSMPVLFKEGVSNMINESNLEEQLSDYVKDNLKNCVDFSIFEKQGLVFEVKEPAVVAEIHNDKVQYYLSFPLTVKKEQSSMQIDNFQAVVYFDFSVLFSVLSEISDQQLQNNNDVPLRVLLDLADKYGFTFEITQLSDEDIVLYSLIFKKPSLNIQPYVFSFAVDFDWTDLKENSSEEESQIILKSMDTLTIPSGRDIQDKPIFFDMPIISRETFLLVEEIDWSQVEAGTFNYEAALVTQPLQGFQASSARAWQAIENNPSILIDNSFLLETVFNREDYLRAMEILNNNPELLTDALIFNQIDRKARQDIRVLNDYSRVMERFFYKNLISVEEGLQLSEYDGIFVKTKGEGATEFNPTNHPDARVLKTGELIDGNLAKISHAKVELDPTISAIRVTGGNLDLTNSKRGTYVTTGDIQVKGQRIFSQHPLELPESQEIITSFTEEKPRFFGKQGAKILIETADNRFITFNGDAYGGPDLSLWGDDIIINQGTRMHYPLGQTKQSLDISVTTSSAVFGSCQEELSCISPREISDGKRKITQLQIISRNGNKLTVETSESAFGSFQIKGIPEDDYSTIQLVLKKANKNNAVIQFGKGNNIFHRNIAGLKTEIIHDYQENNKPASTIFASGSISKCIDGTCAEVGRVPDLTNQLYVRFNPPAIEVNGVKISSGLPKRPMLNGEWYATFLPAVVEKGIDPYFFIAMHILEIGGVRASGFEQKIATDAVSAKLAGRGIEIGTNFIKKEGAGGVVLGDFNNAVKKGHFTDDEILSWIGEMNKVGLRAEYDKPAPTYDPTDKSAVAIRVFGIPAGQQSEAEIWDPTTKLNQASLVLLKVHQDRTLRIADETRGGRDRKITVGLQAFNGLGTLPRVFNEKGQLVQLKGDGSIVPTKGQSTGFTGQQYSLYGESIKNLMLQLSRDKRIRNLVEGSLIGKPTVSTPVLDQVKGKKTV